MLIDGWVQQVTPKLWLAPPTPASKWALLFSVRSALHEPVVTADMLGYINVCVCVLVYEKYIVLMLMIASMCSQISMRSWKWRFFKTSRRIFSQGCLNARVDESLAQREAAATSLLQRIGWVHSRCTFNTSCVDQEALMSTLWDLSSWQCSL